MSEHLKIIRFPGLEVGGSDYSGFVFGTAARSGRGAHRRLASELTKPGVICLVATPAVGDPVYVGWLAANPAENRIVYAYTKAAYRASPEQRRGREVNVDAFRIASSLAIAAGIDFGRPVTCTFYSSAAAAIAGKPGNPYNLHFEGKKQ